MKIAIFNDWWIPDLVGGAEVSAIDNFELLKKGGFDVTVIQPVSFISRKSQNASWVVSVRILSLRRNPKTLNLIKILEKIRVLIDPLSPIIVSATIRKIAPKILVIHQMDRVGHYFIPILKLMNPKMKIIRVYHDLGDSCILRTRFRSEQNCIKTCKMCIPKNAFNAFSSPLIDFAVYNSRFTANHFHSLGYNPKMEKIGFPIKTLDHRDIEFKRKFQSFQFEIGYLGRLHPTKGIEFLIECASEVSGLRLHLVGTGDPRYVAKLLDLANTLSVEIVMHGYRVAPFGLLTEIGVGLLVVPSKWNEPFGRIPLEAAEYGIRVAVSDSGGLKESMELINPSLPTFRFGDHKSLVRIIEAAKKDSETSIQVRISPYPTINSVLVNFINNISN